VRVRYAAPTVASMQLTSALAGAAGVPAPLVDAFGNTYKPPAGPVRVSTEGRTLVTLLGAGFGPAPRDFSDPAQRLGSALALNVSLADAPSLPTAVLVVSFHRTCLVSSMTIDGHDAHVPFLPAPDLAVGGATAAATTPVMLDACAGQDGGVGAIARVQHDRVDLVAAPGIGANRKVTVYVVEDASAFPAALPLLANLTAVGAAAPVAQLTGNFSLFSYNAPSVTSYNPALVAVAPEPDGSGGVAPTVVTIDGNDFGDPALVVSQGWTPQEQVKSGTVGGISCASVDVTRPLGGVSEAKCALPSELLLAGFRNVTVTMAGQTGYAPEIQVAQVNAATGTATLFNPLLLVCAAGFYGRPNETCLPCPAQYPETPAYTGARCVGYAPAVADFNARFVYPRPLAGVSRAARA
jgi:hypothetical protein